MDIEQAVGQLQSDVSKIQVNVAVIRADLDNHITTLGNDVRDIRNKVERLFGVVMSRPERNSNGWKTTTMVVSGWAVGLLMLVLQYLLNK